MSPSPDGQINLDFTKHWCRKHLEPFRSAWPSGVAPAMVTVFQLFSCSHVSRMYPTIQAALDDNKICCVAQHSNPLLYQQIIAACLGPDPEAFHAVAEMLRLEIALAAGDSC